MNNATPLNDKRTINAWALFDWANSAFALTITVAIFPTYFSSVTFDEVYFLGEILPSSSLFAFAITAAYLVLVIVSPILSGIADYGGKKMFFLRFFTIMGALACISLAWFTGMDENLPASDKYNVQQVSLGIVSFIVGLMGFAGGLVFYNSYLPEIATEDQYDRVSAKGFAYGYVGSVLLLLVNMAMIQKPAWFGLADGTLPARVSFVMVGLWWLGFSLIPFRRLPKDDKSKPQQDLVKKGFAELERVFLIIRGERNILSFLMAFFFYSAGVQTVLFLAAIFAEKELNFSAANLILVVLILQVVAIGGAYLFAWVSKRKGNKVTLLIMLVIWVAICGLAYFVQEQMGFYGIASAVGLVMGGIQSLSRSTYSKLLPEQTEDTTSFFSFYDILEKIAIVLGTFTFGLLDYLMGMRSSILALSLFFIVGILILLTVKIKPTSPPEGVKV